MQNCLAVHASVLHLNTFALVLAVAICAMHSRDCIVQQWHLLYHDTLLSDEDHKDRKHYEHRPHKSDVIEIMWTPTTVTIMDGHNKCAYFWVRFFL